jgi:hypothetical protein
MNKPLLPMFSFFQLSSFQGCGLKKVEKICISQSFYYLRFIGNSNQFFRIKLIIAPVIGDSCL